MPIEVKKYLVGIAIGLRFGPSFAVSNESGDIIDYLLYTEGSYFNKTMFPQVTPLPFQVILDNPKTGDRLSISNQDIILNCNFADVKVKQNPYLNPKQKISNIKTINENFGAFLKLLEEHSVDRIKRIGYINRYAFNIPELTNNMKRKLTADSLGEIKEIQTRFAKKYPVSEALVSRNIYNYHNVIFTIEKKPDDDTDLSIAIDYQEYYEPNLTSTAKLEFKEFLKNMERYNNDTFPKWLEGMGGQIVA